MWAGFAIRMRSIRRRPQGPCEHFLHGLASSKSPVAAAVLVPARPRKSAAYLPSMPGAPSACRARPIRSLAAALPSAADAPICACSHGEMGTRGRRAERPGWEASRRLNGCRIVCLPNRIRLHSLGSADLAPYIIEKALSCAAWFSLLVARPCRKIVMATVDQEGWVRPAFLRLSLARLHIMQPMPVRIWSAFFFCSSLRAT